MLDVQKYTLLSINILDGFLPREELAKRRFEELLDYREASRDDLERFRSYIGKITSGIESAPWSPEFYSEIRATIDREVIPGVQDARDRLQDTYERMYGNIGKSLVSKAAVTLTPTLIASALANASIGQILSVGAGAIFAAAGLAIPEVLSAWQQGRSVRRNGLSFLLNLSDPRAMLAQLRVRRALTIGDRGILPSHEETVSLSERLGLYKRRNKNIGEIDDALRTLIEAACDPENRFAGRDAANFFTDLYSSHQHDDHEAKSLWRKRLVGLKVSKNAASKVVDAIASTDRLVATVAVLLTAELRVAGASERIVETLRCRDTESKTQRYGFTALSRIGDRNARYFLRSCVDDRKHPYRPNAMEALAIMGEATMSSAFLSIARDATEEEYDRSVAAYSAAMLGNNEARLMLREAKRHGLFGWLQEQKEFPPWITSLDNL